MDVPVLDALVVPEPTKLADPAVARGWEAPAGLVVLILVAAAMTWWLWGRVGDPISDYGRDPYMAWQLLAGRRLYADLAYPYGPLAPFLNLLVFKSLGVSLRGQTIGNLAVAFVVLVTQYRLFSRVWGVRMATAASLAWVLVFAFGDGTRVQNYNYLTPYTTSATYGYAGCILALACLCGATESRRPTAWVAAGGAWTALAALTKVEYAFAGSVTLTAGVAVVGVTRGMCARQRIGLAAVACAAVIATAGAALAAMSVHTPAAVILAGMSRAYSMAWDPQIRQIEILQVMAGTDFVGRSVTKAVVYFCHYLQVFLPPALLGLMMRGGGRRVGKAARACAAAVLVSGGFAWIRWGTFGFKFGQDFARGVPLFVGAVLVACTWVLARGGRRADDERSKEPGRTRDARVAAQWLVVLFATLILSRMVLNFRLFQNGFVQAAPAAMVVMWVLLERGPALIERAGGYGGLLRWTAVGVVCGVIGNALSAASIVLAEQTETLGAGADAMRVAFKGGVVRDALAELGARAGPNDTVAAIQEGPLFCYLSRRPNPTPYEIVSEFSVIQAGGEAAVVSGFDAAPPDWIMAVGVRGSDPLAVVPSTALRQWLDRNYVAVTSVVHESRPVEPGPGQQTMRFEIGLYQRRPAPGRSPATASTH